MERGIDLFCARLRLEGRRAARPVACSELVAYENLSRAPRLLCLACIEVSPERLPEVPVWVTASERGWCDRWRRRGRPSWTPRGIVLCGAAAATIVVRR